MYHFVPQGLGLDAARALMYSGGGGTGKAGAGKGQGKGKGGSGPKGVSPAGLRGASGGPGGREDPCLPKGYEWSPLHRSAQQGGEGGAAGGAQGALSGLAGLGETPSIATGDFEARVQRPGFPLVPPSPLRRPLHPTPTLWLSLRRSACAHTLTRRSAGRRRWACCSRTRLARSTAARRRGPTRRGCGGRSLRARTSTTQCAERRNSRSPSASLSSCVPTPSWSDSPPHSALRLAVARDPQVHFLGLPEVASLADVAERGRGMCGTEWKRLESAHLSDQARISDSAPPHLISTLQNGHHVPR